MSGKIKAKLLVVVNSLLVVAFVIQLVTVVLSLLGLGGSVSYMLHTNVGIAMLVLVIVHVILNFGWIKSKIFKSKS